MEIDHRCFVPACVNPEHLRLTTHKENNEHRNGASAASQTGFRGVYPSRHGTRWTGRARHNGKDYQIATYATKEEADAAMRELRNKLFTHNDLDRADYARAPQLAPSSEPTCTCFPVPEHLHTTHYGATEPGSMLEPNPECPVHFPPAPSPVRIEDMTPGTEFLCAAMGGRGDVHHMRVTEHTRDDGTRILWCLTHKSGADAPYVDPSTVRDVQSAPTEGDAS